METVINCLRLCDGRAVYMGHGCEKCSYLDGTESGEKCIEHLHADALALLKEHGKPDCEHAEHDGIGCLGYAGCSQDDEPIDACKTCREYTGNRYEEVTGDADGA